jgi:hypothetical protein
MTGYETLDDQGRRAIKQNQLNKMQVRRTVTEQGWSGVGFWYRDTLQ